MTIGARGFLSEDFDSCAKLLIAVSISNMIMMVLSILLVLELVSWYSSSKLEKLVMDSYTSKYGSISEEELLGAQHVLRDAVTKLLIDPVLSKITDLRQVQDIIKDIKFGKRVPEAEGASSSMPNTASSSPNRSSSIS